MASNLFSADFGEQPNIVHSRRLGNPSSTTGQKPRPLLVSFDNSHTAEHFVANAKVLRNSTNVVVRDRVYINKDLTKAQSQAAYELRCKRRAAAVRRRDKQFQQTPSSGDLPVPAQRRWRRDRQPSTGLMAAPLPSSHTQDPNVASHAGAAADPHSDLTHLNPSASSFQPVTATLQGPIN